MKVSREQVAENRRTILEAAGRLFRERGFEGVSVAAVMKAAGLTHGGFYGYFRSKDDLIAAALAELAVPPTSQPTDLAGYVDRYLSRKHCDDRAGGCPVAALGAETVRQTSEVRSAMTDGLRRQIARLGQGMPGADPDAARQAAIGTWAALVGALTLARMSDDRHLADEILSQTRAWIGAGAPHRHEEKREPD